MKTDGGFRGKKHSESWNNGLSKIREMYKDAKIAIIGDSGFPAEEFLRISPHEFLK